MGRPYPFVKKDGYTFVYRGFVSWLILFGFVLPPVVCTSIGVAFLDLDLLTAISASVILFGVILAVLIILALVVGVIAICIFLNKRGALLGFVGFLAVPIVFMIIGFVYCIWSGVPLFDLPQFIKDIFLV